MEIRPINFCHFINSKECQQLKVSVLGKLPNILVTSLIHLKDLSQKQIATLWCGFDLSRKSINSKIMNKASHFFLAIFLPYSTGQISPNKL
jgi:hypothetical protein